MKGPFRTHVIRRLFRRTSAPDPWAPWSVAADEAAAHPSADVIDRLERALAGTQPSDDVESQQEMIEGLRRLLELASRASLPVVDSQHRVVGSDLCHFLSPVAFGDADAAPGKLFLTSRRLVIVTGTVTSRPWHAVGHLSRAGRRLAVGTGETALVIQCNSYGDALVAHHVALRLVRDRQS